MLDLSLWNALFLDGDVMLSCCKTDCLVYGLTELYYGKDLEASGRILSLGNLLLGFGERS